MGDDDNDESTVVKVNKATIDDEFLRHPHSGAFIRNPLLDKTRTSPIIFPAGEFDHNCLDDALAEYQCITVTEASFKEMIAGGGEMTMKPEEGDATATATTLNKSASAGGTMSTLSRAALGRLRELPAGYEFVVALRKSSYAPPRSNRRRPVEARTSTGILVDKVNIEVSDMGGRALRVETINDGLVAVWNRTNPAFQIRQNDLIVKVNTQSKSGAAMVEELQTAPEALRITVRRAPMTGGGGFVKTEETVAA